MNEEETDEKIYLVPLENIKPLSFINFTFISETEENMLLEEMRGPDGPFRIDPILLRPLTPDEVENLRQMFPNAKYENVRYEIIDGHTRYRLAQALGWPWIRARIQETKLEEAIEIAYRKNKERGRVHPLAEAMYFRYLAQDLKMRPWDIASKFGITEKEVVEILNKSTISREARRILISGSNRLRRAISGRLLEVIARAPVDKQRIIAEAIINESLGYKEAEKVSDLIIKGYSIEEALLAAKRPPQTSRKSAEDIGSESEIICPQCGIAVICPNCGVKIKVDWKKKKFEVK